ncbi:MAG: dethiobiotin synthase [Bdellovibrionales bacterium]|nr:dethiobiotin synthase [Bdellovibrionales bacterium]
MRIKDIKRLFVTGNGTEVGKTVVSAILAQALEADYWKPIQAGNEEDSDSIIVSRLVSNKNSEVHPEAYLLPDPISPHAAAERAGIEITFEGLLLPETNNLLIIEGAGGILTPINRRSTMRELAIHFDAPVVVVSSHYLGSINHTLMTIEALQFKNVPILGVIFVGDPEPESETAIISMSGVKMLGRVAWEDGITPVIVAQYARLFREVL